MMKSFKSKLALKLVPLAFSIVIATSFMYIYDSDLTLLFLLCSIVMQSLVYVFYDYISTKNKVLQYVSILGSLVAMIFLVVMVGSLYSSNSMLDFIVWFFSPQGVTDYSLKYIFAVLIGLNFFVASTIYYFTQVRYRMITTFLLMLLPFAIFTKEDLDMPIALLLPLIVLYFTTLIVCGQNNLYKHNDVTFVQNKSYVKSVGTFVLTFMLVCSALPKPQIDANRDLFESLISANSFTNFLLAQLSDFTDTSNGSGFSLLSSNRVLFNVETTETVALKSRTFSSYNYKQNVWLRADGVKTSIEQSQVDTVLYHNGGVQTDLSNYDMYGYALPSDDYTDTFEESLDPAELLNAIVYACTQDSNFADNYGLDTIDTSKTFNSYSREVAISKVYSGFTMVLNPTSGYSFTISDYSDYYTQYVDFYRTDSGIFYGSLKASNGNYATVSEYTVDYYSNSLLNDSNALDILKRLSFEEYGDFLNDLSNIVVDSSFEGTVQSFMDDYHNALTYSEVFPKCSSDKISSLAESITKGCTSDIEKALLLEDYFISNGYTYDAEYTQPEDATIEEFLFNSKTGACYEYSTSMVLMARALGLPARYAEGFLIDNPSGSTQTISVTPSSSHAYPEVYISGYGWCYFEPTQVLLGAEDDTTDLELSANYKLFIASFTVGLVCILASVFMVFVYPKLYERHFRRKVLHNTNSLEVALNLILSRMLKLAKLPNSLTLEEVQERMYTLYHVDITKLVELSNRAFYSSHKVGNDSNLIKTALDVYVLAYGSIIETIKQQKKSKRVKHG